MRCANPECGCGLFDLPGGSIWLMQLDTSCDQPAESMNYGSPLFMPSTKWFWLCPDCSRRFILSRWTPSGVSLVKKRPGMQYRSAARMEDVVSPFPFNVCASARVEEEFLDVG
jgi:hypothetical protein